MNENCIELKKYAKADFKVPILLKKKRKVGLKTDKSKSAITYSL